MDCCGVVKNQKKDSSSLAEDQAREAVRRISPRLTGEEHSVLLAALSGMAMSNADASQPRRVVSRHAHLLDDGELDALWEALADRWMTTAEAAAYLGYSSGSSVRSALSRGQLVPDAYVGRQPRFRRSSLDHALESGALRSSLRGATAGDGSPSLQREETLGGSRDEWSQDKGEERSIKTREVASNQTHRNLFGQGRESTGEGGDQAEWESADEQKGARSSSRVGRRTSGLRRAKGGVGGRPKANPADYLLRLRGALDRKVLDD